MSFERVQKPASPTPAPKENSAVSPKDVYLKRKQLDEPSASSAPQASVMLRPMTTAQWLQSDLVMKTAQGFESSPAKNSKELAAYRNVSPIGPQSLEQPESGSEEQIQTKLTVGAPGDKYEQEADSMAAKVMAMPDSALQQPIQRQTPSQTTAIEAAPPINPIAPLLRRSSGEEEAEIQMKSGVQRASDGSTQASLSIESRLADSKGGGSPLSPQVRGFMEPRFGADFSGIKVHTDSNAVQMNKELGAQAFARGSDIYYSEGKSPGNNELTAHELTHTIQQGGAVRMNKEMWRQPQQEEEAKTLQAKESPLARKEQSLFNKETSFKTWGTYNENLAAKKLPSHSTTNGHNIISRNKEQLQKTLARQEQETPEEPLLTKQFTNSSSFNNQESIQRQPLTVSTTRERIQGGFLGIGNPSEKIAAALAGFASQLPGYSILTLILGKDPISNRPVERTPASLIRALLGLVPNGDKIFNNLQQSGALQKAFSWFNGEIAKLNLTFNAIKTLFGKALSSLGIGDALNPICAFAKIKNIILEPLARIKNLAAAAGTKVMEIAFEGFLNMAGGASGKVMGILRQAGGVFGSIIKDPVSFCGHLVSALRGGFQKFSGNIATHLKNGLTGWLLGALTGAGLTVPAQLDTKGIVSIVLQVMGATYARLRGKLTNKIGEQKVARLEKAFDFLRTIVTGGLAAAWQKIAEFTGNLQETVIGSIKEWVMSKVITAAIAKLISMFNPAGAIIQAAMAIYNTVMFFVERGSQIAALAEAVFSSIGNIAKGNVAGAANYVEQTMGRSLPVTIGFLARLIGLSGVSEQIKNVIKKIQDKVENALNKLANFIVEKGKSLLAGGGGKNKPDTSTQGNNNGRSSNGEVKLEKAFTMVSEAHHLYFEAKKPKTPKVEMATGRRDVLENKVRRAIQQEEQGARRPKLLNPLKQIQAKLASMQWVWEANDGNSQKERQIRYEYLQMLETIATVLTGLGAEFGISDLEFLGHPSKYAEQDSDGKTRLKQEYRNKVRTWFYPNSYRSNVEQWKKTRLATLKIGAPSGHFKDEMTGKFEPINVSNLATNVTIDHISPGVSRHWNMDNGGHNQKQDKRADFYNETSNMRLVAHKNNSSDGSRNAPAYNPEVGPNFRGPDDNP